MEKGREDNPHAPTAWPQYRKMEGGMRLYAIRSPRHFTELQRMGSRWVKYEVVVTVYPELVRVQEMLAMVPPYTECSAAEWSSSEGLVAKDDTN